jgi:hypothetical protein
MNSNVLFNKDSDNKINIDDLYDTIKRTDQNTLISYNKILKRIHTRIKTTAKQKNDSQCCWYIVPEILIGIPKYDVGSCIAYLIDKLKDNEFKVSYTHPNLLFISWNHWIPDYVRDKIKKDTGVEVNGSGVLIKKKDNNNTLLLTNKNESIDLTKEYKSINTYKPSGSLIYNNDLMKKIQDKL